MHKFQKFHRCFKNNGYSSQFTPINCRASYNSHSVVMLLSYLHTNCQVPTHCNLWGSWQLLRCLLVSQSCSCYHPMLATFLSTHSSWNNGKPRWNCYTASHPSSQLVLCQVNRSVNLLLGFIGKLDDGFSRPLVVKYSHRTGISLQTLEIFDNSNRSEGTHLHIFRSYSNSLAISL